MESRMLEEGMKKPPWRPLHLLGVATCLTGSHMFTHFPLHLQQYTAAYWIPYYVGLLLIVVPSMYVQLRLGATTQSNIVSLINKYCPILKGVGFAAVIRLMVMSVYQNVLSSYSLYYAFASLAQPYTWSRCDVPWATEPCQNSSLALNGSMSAQQYFQNEFLQLSADITDPGAVLLKLLLSLSVSWFWVFLLIFPGMYYVGRTVSVLGGSAVIMCIALMAYGREELIHGRPEVDLYQIEAERLVGPEVKDAVLGIWLKGLYDGIILSHTWGGIFPTIGKYAGPAKLLSHMSWLFVFSVLVLMPHLCLHVVIPYVGALCDVSNVTINDALADDLPLLYVVLPAAFQVLSIKRGVASVFFFVVFLFSSQTQALYASVVIDNLVDALRTMTLRCCSRKWVLFTIVSAIYCLLGFTLGIPHVTHGGYYLNVLVHHWINRMICFLIFLSFVSFSVCYAKQQHYPVANKIVFLVWFIVAGVTATAITVYKGGFHSESGEFIARIGAQEYVYPQWAYILGWFIAGGPLVVGLVAGAVHAVVAAKGETCHKKLFSACFPNYQQRALESDRPEVDSRHGYSDRQCADSALRF